MKEMEYYLISFFSFNKWIQDWEDAPLHPKSVTYWLAKGLKLGIENHPHKKLNIFLSPQQFGATYLILFVPSRDSD